MIERSKKNMFLMLVLTTMFLLTTTIAAAQDDNQNNATQEDKNKILLILGCALAIGIAGISSAIGLALAGSSAVAVTAEKPDLFGKCLVLQVLPMTQSVYGLLTAILLMMGSGLLGGTARANMLSPVIGTAAVWIGLAVGLTGISAINQGMVASSSISAVGRNPDVAARGIIYTVMPETIAIFGLLVAILLMTGLGLL
ncbi:V-type ATP synthase subunit K [Euryarchaeota archaeon ex4484_162]|nr:MAG: V-type ATP synthase subunit K [Euryarchaeota archaeon ex4484_162]RLF29559.1 MAG: V-type ATP synthase subunit K [Thermoplasmata archaeon]